MVNSKKVVDTITEYSNGVISKIDKEISELKEKSLAVKFDKKLSDKLHDFQNR